MNAEGPVRASDCCPQMTDKCITTFDWEDVRYFAALAHHGSLAATARALKVSDATVLRRLARLEARMGTPLFTRKGRGLSLTTTGVLALAEAAQMEMAACALSGMCTATFSGTVTGVPARGHRSSRQN